MTYRHKDGMIYDPEDGQTVATMSESATPEQAALLAAAPGLLEALKRIVDWDESRLAMTADHIHQARAAIAKAEGGAA